MGDLQITRRHDDLPLLPRAAEPTDLRAVPLLRGLRDHVDVKYAACRTGQRFVTLGMRVSAENFGNLWFWSVVRCRIRVCLFPGSLLAVSSVVYGVWCWVWVFWRVWLLF